MDTLRIINRITLRVINSLMRRRMHLQIMIWNQTIHSLEFNAHHLVRVIRIQSIRRLLVDSVTALATGTPFRKGRDSKASYAVSLTATDSKKQNQKAPKVTPHKKIRSSSRINSKSAGRGYGRGGRERV